MAYLNHSTQSHDRPAWKFPRKSRILSPCIFSEPCFYRVYIVGLYRGYIGMMEKKKWKLLLYVVPSYVHSPI